MKRLVFGMLVVTSICHTIMAQAPRIYNVASYNRSYNTPAVASTDHRSEAVYHPGTTSVPSQTEKQFRKNYPAAERIQWSRAEDNQWRVSCHNKGQWITLIYNNQAEAYALALPVLRNAVPPEVVKAILDRFNAVYDVAELNPGSNSLQYLVRTFDSNGQLKRWKADGRGEDVVAADK